MQFIRDIYVDKVAKRQPVISFEFFPPKTVEGDRQLLERTIPTLAEAGPDYCSVTYGAGGSTREKTLTIVDQIQRLHGLTAMAHLTCVAATQDQIQALLVEIERLGVRNLLALRGDPPGGGEFEPVPGGFRYSSDLVRFIRLQGDFSIGVAGFPEGHIACKEGKYKDWVNLKAKIDSGADFLITQLFFDNADFFEFRDHMTRHHGVTIPLVPGVIPITRPSQIKRFTELSGARIPKPLAKKLDELGDDEAAVAEFGVEYATRQCESLLAEGAPGIHFYTLNRPEATVRIMKNLGLARRAAQGAS
ncbi:MAG: methylenetetrahydrofolate reductase [NAD(P)H] [Verrucomicrobiia bacterium]